MSALVIVCATVVVLAALVGAYLTRGDDGTAAGFAFVAPVVVVLTALGVRKLR